MEKTKEKVLARLTKDFGLKNATEMTEKYFEMAIRCYGLRETQIVVIAETVSGLWAA